MIRLFDALQLERLERDLFRGTTFDAQQKRIFGGEVIAQALLAAYATVEGRLCHSLHAYFMRPGNPSIPIVLEVDRARDGGSFTTRRVVAVQNGEQILNLSASFQTAEHGLEHHSDMPAVPAAPPVRAYEESQEPARYRPIFIERMDSNPGDSTEGRLSLWMRAADETLGDQRASHVLLAYASDLELLPVALQPHGLKWNAANLQLASLDHALWFHRPFDFNTWLLHTMNSPTASAGRG
ncbi:acyl-CoA thioesterase [Sphingomonas sp. CFBP 13728]|uniref:acyl-CoA thioesterase n=1 Tax=Sphingomonas sp. CFBP 13728 TaxID=2775294 RepID=UPI0018D8EF29|nr:acyl-CoA thioesterase domain-containing protein [Sphingomonas sp. CFBP 13728]